MNPLILYDNALTRGTLASSSLVSGYDVQNIKDQRPYTFIKFAAAGMAPRLPALSSTWNVTELLPSVDIV